MTALVAGVDSSTQSCKVVIREARSGRFVRSGRATHPDGTEVDPSHWWDALQAAIRDAGGLDDVAAISVAGQQHGMVCLDRTGDVVRPALLWNDTRSARAADELVAELGARQWAQAVGSVPVAAFTISKLRWLAMHEPEAASRVAAVCLPHDWLTWRLLGNGALSDLRTDRGDASGTGYWSPRTGEYREDLLAMALGSVPAVPEVAGPSEVIGTTIAGTRVGVGTGDNMGAALGLGIGSGDVVVSIGTSGVACAVADAPTADPSGAVAGFADATGRFLPLVCTLNGAPVLGAFAGALGVDAEAFDRLACSAAPGADGVTAVPYLNGERTPNLPDATGRVTGLTTANLRAANLARAAVEGLLCGLADAIDALRATRTPCDRIVVVGGGARSQAVCEIAPTVFGQPVHVPEPGEYVADGAARQAAWALLGDDLPPIWDLASTTVHDAPHAPWVRERYRAAAAPSPSPSP